jgi:hypothetical protein
MQIQPIEKNEKDFKMPDGLNRFCQRDQLKEEGL